jgi:hypothetical protein
MRRVLPVLAAVVFMTTSFGGCAPMPPEDGGGGLALRVDQSSYSPGDPAVLTLVNGTAADVGYNLCVTALDRRVGDGWEPEPLPLVEVCTMELRLLGPGQTADFRHTLPRGLQAGEYRMRTGVESPMGEGQVGVVTAAFTVRAG